MSEWCQNKRCPEKKNQNQIRGTKGNKYYQSNKAGWYGHWCSMGCREQWFNDNKDTCMNAVGYIDKQILPLDDAWFVEYRYDWRTEEHNRYHLINKLKGVDQLTREQAQTPEDIRQDYGWSTRPNSEAKPLAIQLGLAS